MTARATPNPITTSKTIIKALRIHGQVRCGLVDPGGTYEPGGVYAGVLQLLPGDFEEEAPEPLVCELGETTVDSSSGTGMSGVPSSMQKLRFLSVNVLLQVGQRFIVNLF